MSNPEITRVLLKLVNSPCPVTSARFCLDQTATVPMMGECDNWCWRMVSAAGMLALHQRQRVPRCLECHGVLRRPTPCHGLICDIFDEFRTSRAPYQCLQADCHFQHVSFKVGAEPARRRPGVRAAAKDATETLKHVFYECEHFQYVDS